MNGHYRYKKRFYGLSDIPTIFQEKKDRTLNYRTSVCLDDIKLVPRGDKEKYREKLFTKLGQLQEAGCRASEKNRVFCRRNNLAGSGNNRLLNRTEQRKDESHTTIKNTDIN